MRYPTEIAVPRHVLATRSTLGSKVLMAATGLTLALWTVLHMAGNLLVFAGPEFINGYGAALQRSPLIWLMRGGLLVLITVHIARAVGLWRMSSRPQRYHQQHHRRSGLSARTMRLGGVSIALFTLYHVMHIFGFGHVDYRAGDVYHNVTVGLAAPLPATIYLLATIFFCAHLRHGIWSAGRSLGLARSRIQLERLALGVAVVVGLGFSAPCVAALSGWFG